MHRVAELLRGPGDRPPAVGVAAGADLGDDVERVVVGVQCLPDEPVGHRRPVGLAGVEVGDAELDRSTQDADRFVVVGGRSHDAGAGELHRAVAEPGDDEVGGEVERAAGKGCVGHAATLRRRAARCQVPVLPVPAGTVSLGLAGPATPCCACVPSSVVSGSSPLGEYLRARRELVRPGDVGLPAFGPRRVAGLRREEVAMLAGISSDYYLRLEQGRDRNPSSQVLDSLARVLRLDETATAYLLGLASPPPRRRARRPRPEQVPAGIQALVASLDLPAFVEGRYTDVLAANALATAVSPNLRVGANRMRTMFLDPGEHALCPSFEQAMATMVADLRRAVGTDTDDPRFIELVGELSLASEEFRQLWARHDVVIRECGRTAMSHPQLGELTLHKERLAIAGGDGLVLVIYHPAAGTGSEEKLALLASLVADPTSSPAAVDVRQGA